jgi:hypothetical protein
VLGGYVPVVEDRFSFPRTPEVAELRAKVGEERLVVLSRDSIRADANLIYGVSLLTNYDALDIAEYQRLFMHFFSGRPDTLRASKRALELFGVRRVATRSEWIPIDTELGDLRVDRFDASAYLLGELQPERSARPLAELTRERPWSFEFESARDGLDAVCLLLLDEPAARVSSCAVRLRDLASGEVLFERSAARGGAQQIGALHRLPDGHLELVLPFETGGSTRGRAYELELASADRTSAAPIRIARGGKRKGYRPHGSEGERDEGPALDLAYGRAEFESLGRAGQHFVWDYAAGRGRGWIVAHAISVSSSEEAFAAVTGEQFDPYASVVLEGPGGGAPDDGSTSSAVLVAETPTSQHWRTSSARAGWFVLAQSYFPGWSARLDGRSAPVLRANHAFTALALEAGEHEIELLYEPASFRIGALVSLACVLAGFAALVAARRASRRSGR